jgi:hypothetical protein
LLPGISLLGASTLYPGKQPEYITPSSVEELRKRIETGTTTPLGSIARGELSRWITSPFGTIWPETAQDPYVQSQFRQMEEVADREKKRMEEYHSQFGSPYSGEHLQDIQDIEDNLAQAKEDFTAQFNVQRRAEEINTRVAAVQQATGLDQQTIADLIGITGLDIEAAAIKYGVDVANLQSFRQMMGMGGLMSLAGAGGLFSPYSTSLQTLGSYLPARF